MVSEKITLANPERFAPHKIDRDKLLKAAEKACEKLWATYEKNGEGFPGTCSKDFEYELSENTNWESGMYTGCFWLAYELTGDEKFRKVAESHFDRYKKNIDEEVGIHDHDVGFIYTPSLVAQYKLTGNEDAKEVALRTAKFYFDHSYSKEGKFIIRSYRWFEKGGNRTMMDSLMNAPFLFWAGKETGNEEYFNAAHQQSLTTEKLLIRGDGSSFHHYEFNAETLEPVRGLTLQGFSDESCWGRGHSWGIYGFPIAYSYTKDEKIRQVHKDVAYYFLNRLPEDYIPYWDYIFTEPSDEARDSSCAAISACGFDEMSKLIPDDAEEKAIFEGAAARMLEALIDKCTGDIGREYDGLINQVTHALPQGQGIEECAVYGDYFYLEALVRFLKPDFKKYW